MHKFAYDTEGPFTFSPAANFVQFRIDRYLYRPTLTLAGGAFNADTISVLISTVRDPSLLLAAPLIDLTQQGVLELPVGYFVTLSSTSLADGVVASVGGVAFATWTDNTKSGPG